MELQKDNVYQVIVSNLDKDFADRLFNYVYDSYNIQPQRLYELYPAVFEYIQSAQELDASKEDTLVYAKIMVDKYITNKKIKKRKMIYSIIGNN